MPHTAITRSLCFTACLGLAACSSPVTTSTQTVVLYGNTVQITSGTLSKGRFVNVADSQKTWEGDLKGGKEKWGNRRDALHLTANSEIIRICGDWFALTKGPIYNMLDSDETMGGVAPALGVSVAMIAYIVADAATQDTNVPASTYVEFTCPKDEK